MIIGITGTDGAGKGSVVDYLVKEKGFVHYSGRGVIVEAIEAKGGSVEVIKVICPEHIGKFTLNEF